MTSTLTPPTSVVDELDDEPAPSKLGRTKHTPLERHTLAVLSFMGGVIVALLVALVAIYTNSSEAKIEQPSDIRSVYSHSIIVTAREGDTLKSVADATFQTDIASEKDLAAYLEAWQDTIAIRSRSTGTVQKDDLLVVPALPDEPGAFSPDDLPEALEQARSKATKK